MQKLVGTLVTLILLLASLLASGQIIMEKAKPSAPSKPKVVEKKAYVPTPNPATKSTAMLLIQTDKAIMLFLDGQKKGSFGISDDVQRLPVSAGKYLLTIKDSDGKRLQDDQFIEVKPNDKQLLTYRFGATETAATPTRVPVQPAYEPKPPPAVYNTQTAAAEIARNLVRVAGGSFQMGSSVNNYEILIHTVRLSSFSISKFEITQRQWEAIMGSNPSRFNDCPTCPVETISWEDTQEFLSKLNRLSGKSYRLPTEAEWEYAARGGSQSQGYAYSGSSSANVVAWYNTNSISKNSSGRSEVSE